MKKLWISIIIGFILIGIGSGITVTEVLRFTPEEVQPTTYRVIKEEFASTDTVNGLPNCDIIIDHRYVDRYLLEVSVPEDVSFYYYMSYNDYSNTYYEYAMYPSNVDTFNLLTSIQTFVKEKKYPIYSSDYFRVKSCTITTAQP